jgi:hypothetical protein
MNTLQLMHPKSSTEVHSNGAAKIIRATPIAAELQASDMPSVVYHGLKNNLQDTGANIVEKIYKLPQENPEATKTQMV